MDALQVGEEEQKSVIQRIFQQVAQRPDSFCNYLEGIIPEWGEGTKLIYRHYATLYFVFAVDSQESDLGILDLVQGERDSEYVQFILTRRPKSIQGSKAASLKQGEMVNGFEVPDFAVTPGDTARCRHGSSLVMLSTRDLRVDSLCVITRPFVSWL